jgi:hypothetical protein
MPMYIFYLIADDLNVNKNGSDDNRIIVVVFLPVLVLQINFC